MSIEDMDRGKEEVENIHRLWVNLSALGEGNVFAILPQILETMLTEESFTDFQSKIVDMIFPSNYEWRTKVYLKMLNQRRQQQENMEFPSPDEGRQVLHHWNITPKEKEKKACSRSDIEIVFKQSLNYEPGPITWTVKDLSIAGCLLATPPLSTHFEDEQEMRRVYKLIYDVFRYKMVLNRALNDIAFFTEYPKLKLSQCRVWLLLYDLYHRSFKKRDSIGVKQVKTLFVTANLSELEDTLWNNRIRIAAAISRIRIKHSALRLNDLLPHHLKDEKLTNAEDRTPLCCWTNIKKVKSIEDVTHAIIEQLGLTMIEEKDDLRPNSFKYDTHCPYFILFHPTVRSALAKTALVKKYRIIVQDRSFCLGPATFGKIISDLQLSGSVVQSHVNSPRTTAYLATILSQNIKINKLLAFSAGNRKEEYDKYFHDLGVKNILTYSEKFIDVPCDSSYLEEVVAVFATPPNSYSAVHDPIDLVCSRGGDLSMLEALTEAEDTQEGKERVANILNEQRSTLKYAMSKPQIQFVLYETHSELYAENNGMVQKTLKEINKLTHVHHASQQGKIKITPSHQDQKNEEINNNEKNTVDELYNEEPDDGNDALGQGRNSNCSFKSVNSFDEKQFKDVFIPETDIFDVPQIPDLCPNADICLNLTSEGCFLALIQRKKVTRLDNKYMIEIAETRGLFGITNNTTSKTNKGSKSSKPKKSETVPSTSTKKKRKSKTIEIERIMAPTMSSALHSKLACNVPQCPRCNVSPEITPNRIAQTRRWWAETTRHLTNLRTSLIKQKLLPPSKKVENDTITTTFVNSLINSTAKIDEIVAKSTNTNIPVYPRLRLPRNKKNEKIPLPLNVTLVQFPPQTMSVS